MMGLASTSPAHATVKISGRSARKHYGINCGSPYSQEHGNVRKIWDACSGIYRSYMMEWFIEKVFFSCYTSLRYLDRADVGKTGQPSQRR